MTPRSRTPAAVATVVLLLALAAAVFWRESQQARAAVDQPAPAFALPDLSGREVTLQSLAGDVVFINFWTTWCDGCIIEMPALVTFQQRFGHRLQQIGINVQEPLDTVTAFMDEFGVNYETLLDVQGHVPDRYRLRAFPESWFIDGEGIARYHKPGPMTFEEMVAAYELTAGEPLTGEEESSVPGVGQARAIWADGSSVWVGGSGGLWRLQAGNWREVEMPGTVTSVYVLEPTEDGSDVIVGTDAGLFVTTGDGTSLVPLLPGLPAGPVTGFAVSPAGPLAWVSGHGLFVHSDGGWQPQRLSLQLAYPWVRLQASAAGVMFAATPDGLLRSDDSGVTWSPTRHQLPVYDLQVVADAVWLAGDEGVYKISVAPGREGYEGILPGREKWLSIYAGAPARRLTAVAAMGKQVWALSPDGDVYASQPGQWQLVWPELRQEER